MPKNLFAATCFLVVCSALALSAQEVPQRKPLPAPLGVINDVDVLVTNVTLEKLDNPPKREIKFERVEEAVKQRLFQSDPKLVEQKYLAIVRLEVPKDFQINNLNSEQDKEVFALQLWGDRFLFQPTIHTLDHGNPPHVCIGRMLKQIPEDRHPPDAELALFTSDEIDRVLSYDSASITARLSRRNIGEFRILAGTPEQAEQRVSMLLTLLDLGVSRPIQMALFKKRGLLEDELRVSRKLLAAKEAVPPDLERQLAPFADFTKEMLPGLRVQQLQLEVDLAGIKARIAACEKLLQKSPSEARRQQLEDAKIAAEIELSGFEARRAKSEEFVGKVKQKIELSTQLRQAEVDLGEAHNACRQIERRIRLLDSKIQAYSPLPLVDGKVVIAPLEWIED